MFGTKINILVPKKSPDKVTVMSAATESCCTSFNMMDTVSTELSSHCSDQTVTPDRSNEMTVILQSGCGEEAGLK